MTSLDYSAGGNRRRVWETVGEPLADFILSHELCRPILNVEADRGTQPEARFIMAEIVGKWLAWMTNAQLASIQSAMREYRYHAVPLLQK